MKRCMLIVLLALPAGASFAQEAKAPPFEVTVWCRTLGLDPEAVKAFHERVRQIAEYAKETGRGTKRGDKEGWQQWSFEVAGESKFDPGLFQRAFAGVPTKKYELAFTGTAAQDPQTKVIFLTSAKGTAKVKLMNGRRDPFKPEQEVEDIVSRVSAAIAKGRKEFSVKGEIFNHGGTLALLLESFSPDPGSAKEEAHEDPKKAPAEPYSVIVTAKSRFAKGKDGYNELLSKIEKVKPNIRLVSQSPVPGDNAGWEIWKFSIAGEMKLDVSIFPRLFGDIKTSRYELEITGSATRDPKTKIIFVTANGGNVKVKLMNQPRKSVTDEVADSVAKVSEEMDKGTTKFWVRGEIFNHGGTMAILLDNFRGMGK
jgi:hypothetical protein